MTGTASMNLAPVDLKAAARSPLASALKLSSNELSIAALPKATAFAMGERPFPVKIALIGEGEAFTAAASMALGVALPLEPNAAAQQGNVTILWLSPEEWLVVTAQSDSEKIEQKLHQSMQGICALVVDVSDRWATITLKGSQAQTVLSKGMSLNVESPQFGPGHCASTTLAQAQVILHQLDDFPTFDVYVDSTFAEPLWCWLNNAAQEFEVILFAPDD